MISNTEQGSPNQAKWGNSRPISAEVALPRLQSEIKVAVFLLIDKAIVINGFPSPTKLTTMI
jgi:hypothetical protein